MIKEYLPLKVDPFRFADNQTNLQGFLLIKDMDRLASSLASPEGMVEAHINFGIDEQGLRYVAGSFKTSLVLQCQRCLESFNYEIMSDFKLRMVQSEEEADEFSSRYDFIVVQGAELSIQSVIEDELIVNLPIVPMHPLEECKVSLPLVAESQVFQAVEKENPFKVIELLREKRERNK